MVRSFAFGERLAIVPGLFDLTLVYNRGAAFSFLASASGWQRWFFTALGVGAAVFIVWLLARHGSQRLFAFALALILGGAIGNVIDRIARGQVVDFVLLHWQRLSLAGVQRRRQRDHRRRGAAGGRRAATGTARPLRCDIQRQ